MDFNNFFSDRLLYTGAILDERTIIFTRGSVVKGTVNKNTKDIDYVAIVPDDFHILTDKCENGIGRYTDDHFDYQIVTKSRFKELLDEHDVMAVEAMFLPDIFVNKGSLDEYKKYFKTVFDLWKLRQSFSAVASNSWVKAKKKMTVEKDYDKYCGQKSLYHSLMTLHEAIDIAEKGEINWYALSGEFRLIIGDGYTWKDYENHYKRYYKQLHSKLVKLCPKPVEK